MYTHMYTHMFIHMYMHMCIHMHIHMKRKNLKRKSAKSYPRRCENKRELLKALNETQKPQKKKRKKLSPEARQQTRALESLK